MTGHMPWFAVDTVTVIGGGIVPRTVTIVWVRGEVDLSTRTIVDDALERATADATRDIVVDVSAMVFCGAGGLGTFMKAGDRARRQGTSFALVGLSTRLVALCAALWPGPHPAQHATMRAAVAAGAVPERSCRGLPA